MKHINTENVVIKSWCNEPEETALAQAKNLANLPFIFRHVCLMPDTHAGYGMPIGGVMATKNVVIPNAVGVDIGCGMLAVKSSLSDIETDKIKRIMSDIRALVPVGFNHQLEKQDESLMPEMNNIDHHSPIWDQYEKARKQLGTLGGGNHFIEIQRGDDGCIWFMVHSGSRNIGLKVATYHNDIAVKSNQKWYSAVPKEWELAFLPWHDDMGKNYMNDMRFCLDFALANRKLMANRIAEAFNNHTSCNFGEEINIHHNYAALEGHFNKNVVVHRKGATSAKKGQMGIIPGSQGTRSYIVEGKGSRESFLSCSHGAGRTMGRKMARKTLDLKAEIAMLEEKGIIHAIRSEKELDEAPSAYKDIDVVMEEQKDLVEILVTLEPLAVVKG